MINAKEKIIPGDIRKCKVPESSEVAALVAGEQYVKLDIILRCRSECDSSGFEKLELINLGHRMHNSLAYSLLFQYGKYGWRCVLKHKDSKENSKKVSPMNFCPRLLLRQTCDFNVLFHSGRLFQQYSCEIFVKVDWKRL